MPPALPANRAGLGTLPPLRVQATAISTADYGTIPIDTAHPLFNERLVDITDHGIAGTPFYHQDDGRNPPYGQRLAGSLPVLLLRASVAARLADVNRALAPLRLEVFVWDAYRPLETQTGLWQFFEDLLRRQNPAISDSDLRAMVLQYVSDPNRFAPDDPTTWPTHMTGGSVDLTLRDLTTGALLDMGAEFDQMDAVSHTAHFETLRQSGQIDAADARLLHRRLLCHAMATQGFTNYPLEFWHFDWGNQMYQLQISRDTAAPGAPAWYGAVKPGPASKP